MEETKLADNVKFYLPGLDLAFVDFYKVLINYMHHFPDRFRENIEIGALYGTFPNVIWSGGRYNCGEPIPGQEMGKIIIDFNHANIPIRYTYTNNLIQDEDCFDKFANFTMEIANTGKNEVLVNSPILEKYLRNKYPDFKYCLSTTACERNVDKINELTKTYDMVVIDYRDNRNFEFLEKIEDKDKIEILVNEICPSSCPYRKKHYELISKANLYQCSPGEATCLYNINSNYGIGFYASLDKNKDTSLTVDDVFGKYYDMGFRNIKLIGRKNDTPLFQFESYIYYMVKPEWKDIVRYDLLQYYVDFIVDEEKRHPRK